jgi:hypothetical protein
VATLLSRAFNPLVTSEPIFIHEDKLTEPAF